MSGFIRVTADAADGDFELNLSFSKGGFSGQGDAYFSANVLLSFCKDLGQFPLAFPLPSLKGGYWKSDEDSTVLALETLGVWIESIDSHGYAALKVLAAKPHDNRDDFSWSHTACAEFRVSYEQLDRFSKDIVSLVNGRVDEVILREEH